MVLAGFALFIIALLIIGMPVAFTLSLAGILGIIQFVDMSTLSQVPVIAFKTLNSYVLTSVPLYILMSQIMLTGRWAAGSSTWAANGWATFPAAWALPPSCLRHFRRHFRLLCGYCRHHRRHGHSGNAQTGL